MISPGCRLLLKRVQHLFDGVEDLYVFRQIGFIYVFGLPSQDPEPAAAVTAQLVPEILKY